MQSTGISFLLFVLSVTGFRFGPKNQQNTRIIDPKLLPGDPSLRIDTNIDFSDTEAFPGGKLSVMCNLSKTIATVLGKPESYVAVSINSGVDMIWGGESTPCALGTLTSLGGINLENNKAIQMAITAALSAKIRADRIYITYMDVARENMGWDGKTFAG